MALGLPEPEIILTFFIPPLDSISGASLGDLLSVLFKTIFLFSYMRYLMQALFLALNCKAHTSFSMFKFHFGILFFLDIYQDKLVANLFLFTLLVSHSLM